jgi:hypothetical protein
LMHSSVIIKAMLPPTFRLKTIHYSAQTFQTVA